MGVSALIWGKMLDKPVMVLSMKLMYFVSKNVEKENVLRENIHNKTTKLLCGWIKFKVTRPTTG